MVNARACRWTPMCTHGGQRSLSWVPLCHPQLYSFDTVSLTNLELGGSQEVPYRAGFTGVLVAMLEAHV